MLEEFNLPKNFQCRNLRLLLNFSKNCKQCKIFLQKVGVFHIVKKCWKVGCKNLDDGWKLQLSPVQRDKTTVLPLIIPAGIINFLPFFCWNYWRAGIIRWRELLEVLKFFFFNYQFICITVVFPDRFLIIFFIFSHLKRFQTIFCEFF